MRTRIKFCGLCRRQDVELAVALGVDAIGLILAPRSPRRLSLQQARELRASLPPFVAAVTLVMDAEPREVDEIARVLRPHYLQFHGSESPQDCARTGLPWLKAIPMAEPGDAQDLVARYAGAAAFVFDGHAAGEAGGGGRRFDWSKLPRLARERVILAGGLNPDNVREAVRSSRPWAVDVSSGIESAPGEKDADRMRRFVAEVRRADDEA